MTTPEQVADVLGMRAADFTGGLPVTEFIGDLSNARSEYSQERKRMQIVLEFSNTEIIKTTSPWDYPTLAITMNSSTRRNSAPGILITTAQRVAGQGITIRDLVGKRLHLDKHTMHNFGKDAQTGESRDYPMWELRKVIGEVGGEPISPIGRVLELLNGRRMAEFNAFALADPVLKGTPEMIGMVLDGTLVESLLVGGKVTVDSEGIYHAS